MGLARHVIHVFEAVPMSLWSLGVSPKGRFHIATQFWSPLGDVSDSLEWDQMIITFKTYVMNIWMAPIRRYGLTGVAPWTPSFAVLATWKHARPLHLTNDMKPETPCPHFDCWRSILSEWLALSYHLCNYNNNAHTSLAIGKFDSKVIILDSKLGNWQSYRLILIRGALEK